MAYGRHVDGTLIPILKHVMSATVRNAKILKTARHVTLAFIQTMVIALVSLSPYYLFLVLFSKYLTRLWHFWEVSK